MNEKQKKRLTVAVLALLILLSLVIAWFVGRPLIRHLKEPEAFRQWVDSHGMWGKLAFIGISVLQIVVAIIPGEPIELFAGYAFGTWEGTLLCEIAILLGGALVYAFVHRYGRRALNVFFSQEKIDSLRFLQNENKLELWVFILFFIPGTPKDIMTWFVPLTRMKFTRFLLISGVARLPSVITSIISGSALGDGRHGLAVIVFAATAAISAVGLLVYRAICKKREQRHAAGRSDAAKEEP